MGFSIKMIDLELNNVPGVRLNMEIMAGERIGLTGLNGVGKSSLLRYLSCLERPAAMGQLLLNGNDPFHAHDMDKLRGELAYLLQEPEQGIVFSRVSEDAVFGPENLAVEPEIIRKRWKGLSGRLLNNRQQYSGDNTKPGALVKAGSFGDRDFRSLSGGQKQKAALVSALMMRAPLLLLDEPFSMLGKTEAADILTFILGMTKRLEQTMVLVSHDPGALRKMDRVISFEEKGLREICFRKGKWIYRDDGSGYELFPEYDVTDPGKSKEPDPDTDKKRSQVGKVIRVGSSELKIPQVRDRQENEGKEAVPEEDTDEALINPKLIRVEGVDTVEVFSPVISMEGVNFRYGNDQVIGNFSTAVYPGIYYELTGGTGCGKTTLCKLMNATLLADSGHIIVKGIKLPVKEGTVNRRNNIQEKESLRLLRRIVGYVMQHPEDQLFASTVLDDVMFGPLRSGKDKNAARQDAEDALMLLGLDRELWKKPPEKLSGGEKRRAAIAGVLAMKPEVFILDEPFAGLDIEGTELLKAVLREYVRMGRTVIVTSHGERP